MHRIYLAFLCFFRVLFGKPLPDELLAPALPATPPAPEPPRLAPPPAAEPPKRTDREGALLLLNLLQREGRLVDFLQETIDGYDDATVGVAVRDIHRGCRKVLEEHLALEPILEGVENDPVVVPKGFDPGHIRLVGQVNGDPPFRGVLRHHGWRVAKVALPEVADGIDHTVVAPAEVEV